MLELTLEERIEILECKQKFTDDYLIRESNRQYDLHEKTTFLLNELVLIVKNMKECE